MMLDTSAIAGFFKGTPGVADFCRTSDELYVNPVVIGELIAGFTAGANGPGNRQFLSRFLSSQRVMSVDIDEETSERYAAIHSLLRRNGTPIPTNDVWIAASAMQHGLKLLTSDGHFLKVPQIIVEHFQAS